MVFQRDGAKTPREDRFLAALLVVSRSMTPKSLRVFALKNPGGQAF
jgi:hypothetical protein